MKKAPKRKRYGDGGKVTVDTLTPEQKAEYDGLDNDAAKADFLKLLNGGTDAETPTAAGGGSGMGAGLAAAGNVAGDIVTKIDQKNGKESMGGDIGSGALKGAGTGAAIGSVIPGIGTAVGAVAGAVVGGIGGYMKGKAASDAELQAKKVANMANAGANTMNANTDIQTAKDGGSIHINPANKGKFNATKKATGKTTEELTHSSNPVTKKRAVFAQNAAKWQHKGDGGTIDPATEEQLLAMNQPIAGYTEGMNQPYVQTPAGYGIPRVLNNTPAPAANVPTQTMPAIDTSVKMMNGKPMMRFVNSQAPGGEDWRPISAETYRLKTKASTPTFADGGDVHKPKEWKYTNENGDTLTARTVTTHPLIGKPHEDIEYEGDPAFKGGLHNVQGDGWKGEKHRYSTHVANPLNHDIEAEKKRLDKISIKAPAAKQTAQKKADGGEVDGPGTAKSDSIKTKLKPGSFVVPAENIAAAKALHAHYFGVPTKLKSGGSVPVALSDGEFVFSPRQVAYLKQKGVNLNSLAPNAEPGNKMKGGGFAFQDTKDENLDKEIKGIKDWIQRIESGKDTRAGQPNLSDYKNQLAKLTARKAEVLKFQQKMQPGKSEVPKQSQADWAYANRDKFKDGSNSKKIIEDYITQIGGKGGQRTSLGQAMDLSISRTNLAVLMDQVKGGKKEQYQDDYNEKGIKTYLDPTYSETKKPKVAPVAAEARILPDSAYKAPVVPAPTDAVQTKGTRKAPAIKKPTSVAAATAGTPAGAAAAVANRGFNMLDPNSATAGTADMSGDPYRDVHAAVVAAQPKDISGNTDIPLKEGNKFAAAAAPTNGAPEDISGENGFTKGMALLGAGQTAFGIADLLSSGKRPQDVVDPTLVQRRDRAIDEATVKMDPAVQAAAENDIELNRRGTLNAVYNAAGTDVGLGIAGALGANRESNRSHIQLAGTKEAIGMEKSQIANQLTGQVAESKRRIFDDKLTAFKENQASAAALTQAGINNYIESRRLANSNRNYGILDKLNSGAQITEADIAAYNQSRKIKIT